jgi:hypothetical protein
MLTAIATLKLLLSIGPDLMKFMKSIEDMLPDSGKGAEKLAILRGYLEGAWAGLGNALPAFEEFWPKLNTVITAVVSVFNSVGLFKKS